YFCIILSAVVFLSTDTQAQLPPPSPPGGGTTGQVITIMCPNGDAVELICDPGSPSNPCANINTAALCPEDGNDDGGGGNNVTPIVTSLTNTLCRVTDALTGPIGTGIASIAVIFLGFALFLGKVSWGLALSL